MKTKAAVLYERNTPLRIDEVTLDEPNAEEVLVRIGATGVCHTDLSVIRGVVPFPPVPIVLGHEGAGIVEKVGPGVTSLKQGDHVALSWVWSCGKCRFCASGNPVHCRAGVNAAVAGSLPGGGKRMHADGKEVQVFSCVGSFAEYVVVPERTAIKIREDVPMEVAALFGCAVTTGVGGVVNAGGVRPGESVAVFGCGAVGLSAIMGARLCGAGLVIAVDLVDQKLEKAKELGADQVINASREDPVKRIRQMTGGGADYTVECIGNAKVVAQAFAAIHTAGKCIVLGADTQQSMVSIPSMELTVGKTLTGSRAGSIRASIDIPRYIDLYMSGRLPVDKLISQVCKLEDINRVIQELAEGKVIRSVIKY